MKKSDAAAERVQRELFIRTRLARLAEPGLVALVARFAEEVTFSPGAVIHRRGDPPVDFYGFVRGEVELAPEGVPPMRLSDQSGIGLLDVLAEHPRRATVTAVSRVRAMRIRAEDYLDFLEEHFELAMTTALRGAKTVHELSLSLAPDGGFPAITLPEVPTSVAPVRPLDLVQKVELLRRSRAFRKANVQALVRLALLAREVRLDADEVLFRRREAQGRFFLVARGIVEASHDAPALVARFGRGDLVCGYGALGNADDQYVATARTPAIALSFVEEDFFDVMEEHFALTRSIFAGIATDYTLLLIERERRAAKSASK